MFNLKLLIQVSRTGLLLLDDIPDCMNFYRIYFSNYTIKDETHIE